MKFTQAAIILGVLGLASGQITPAQNFLPVSFTVSSAPFDIIATPITPVAPYSQAAYQCNVTGDSRFPPYASGTFPLTLAVPIGTRVRVIFANGNLNGATVTQQGEPGVIVQQGGSPIVQQAGGASPIVQRASSPVVQQTVASPAALVVQQTPTVVQQPFPAAPSIPSLPPIVTQPSTPATPAATPAPTTKAASPPPPTAVSSPPPRTASPPPTAASPPPTASSPPPTAASPPPTASSPPPTAASPPPTATTSPPPSPTVNQGTVNQGTVNQGTVNQSGRRLLQDSGLVPGGPNGGLVEYVALSSANTVPGFFAGSTQFGVPYVEFTASAAAAGQTAMFRGALVVAQVVNGQPIFPFVPNQSLSPNCQVNVNFTVA